MKKQTTTAKTEVINTNFAFGKQNYMFLAIGFVIIIIGFLLMIGGGSDDPNVFNPEIFSVTRITVAPMIVIAGFIFVMWAIMRNPKKSQQ
ncbi:MAG: hypothetical protein A2033_05675 [Bacteroidetes bacterium GWA2_31_9]|nr:MAG: hypothetical protein A2033_05675 [Bacteroidetes bacterium GWA2_31_9]